MSKKKIKKKNSFIKKIFRTIYKTTDKLIVTPISKVVYRINKLFKTNIGFFENILGKPHAMLILSLIIAIGAFLIIDSKAINLVETESELLSGQPVTVIYNEEKYVVEGIPEKVDIILMGRKSDLYLAKQLGEHKIVLDLSDYKVGEYNVKLKYNHSVESVTYKLDPGSVTVKISEKISSVKSLSYDLLNQDKLDSKLNVSNVEMTTSEVYVKGSSETLDKVATVKALIDVSTIGLTDSGEYEIDSIPLAAYDTRGHLVDNVEVVPETAKAKITVDSYYKDLPVKVVPIGSFATGYAIASAKSSVETVRVYGDQNTINGLDSISAEIDIDGLSADKKFNVTLVKPSGVRYMSDTTTTVSLSVGRESTRELDGVSVQVKGLGNNYVANTVNKDDTTCTVILKGVNEIIESIQSDSVTAFVDLSGYGPGTYDVPIEVEGQDLTVTYTAKVKTIQVKITG